MEPAPLEYPKNKLATLCQASLILGCAKFLRLSEIPSAGSCSTIIQASSSSRHLGGREPVSAFLLFCFHRGAFSFSAHPTLVCLPLPQPTSSRVLYLLLPSGRSDLSVKVTCPRKFAHYDDSYVALLCYEFSDNK